MIINKEKVISIPREYRDKEGLFVCPCPICAEKMYHEKAESLQLEQAKHIIENIFETTALDGKEFQVNVAYADVATQPEKIKRSSELRAVRTAVKTILSLTSQFNKKYRHPLMCKLNAHTLSIQKEVEQYDTMNHYGDVVESRLWKLEDIAKKTDEINALLTAINAEEFIDTEKIAFLKNKVAVVTKENKAQLKKLFINALKMPEFEPHCSSDDYQLPYY